MTLREIENRQSQIVNRQSVRPRRLRQTKAPDRN